MFCEDIVESKRHGRTLVAVMNGMSIAQARRAGMIEEDYDAASMSQPTLKRNTMFVGDDDDEDDVQYESQQGTSSQQTQAARLNPASAVFSPGDGFATTSSISKQPKWMTGFGQSEDRSPDSAGGPPKGLFGPKTVQQEQPSVVPSSSSLSPFSFRLGTPALPLIQPSSLSNTSTSLPSTTSAFTGFNFSQTSEASSLSSKASPAAEAHEQELLPKSAPQPSGSGSIFNLFPQDKSNASAVPKSTPTFTWAGTSATKPTIQASESVQPIFNLTPSSSSGSIPGKFQI